jgi:hypothetical protein
MLYAKMAGEKPTGRSRSIWMLFMIQTLRSAWPMSSRAMAESKARACRANSWVASTNSSAKRRSR